jgi:hypothetical protein
VSRRTDIPAFYSEWFFNRLLDGFVYVRNPFNPHQIKRVSLKRDDVYGIVFWTKNPAPMIERMHWSDNTDDSCLELSGYMYYFHFTINGYDKDIEPGLPDKENVIATFQNLAHKLYRKTVIWRYDPILINEHYTEDWHVAAFEQIAQKLQGYTKVVVISFIDAGYREVKRNMTALSLSEITPEIKITLSRRLVKVAKKYGMCMAACAEEIDLSACGIERSHCISDKIFGRDCVLGTTSPMHKSVVDVCVTNIFSTPDQRKDKNQRPACGCVTGTDIGAYNSCKHGCLYCYANYNSTSISSNFALHNPESPLLFGEIDEKNDIIKG